MKKTKRKKKARIAQTMCKRWGTIPPIYLADDFFTPTLSKEVDATIIKRGSGLDDASMAKGLVNAIIPQDEAKYKFATMSKLKTRQE